MAVRVFLYFDLDANFLPSSKKQDMISLFFHLRFNPLSFKQSRVFFIFKAI